MSGNEKQSKGYGFKANLREEPSSVIVRIEWLENIIKTSYSITAKRSLIGAVLVALPSLFAWFYLTADPTRAKFLTIAVLILISAVIVWVLLYMFIDPSSGSLLSGNIKMLKFINNYVQVIIGRKKKLRNGGIKAIHRDGRIEFVNNDVGKLFFMDGKTSATAYPEEIQAQENLTIKYHNARNRTTMELKITSSQKQNAERQRANFSKEKAMNRGNKPVQDIVDLQDLFVKNAVEGKRTQNVQYLLVRDSSQVELDKHIARLRNFNNRGMYYSLVGCNGRETYDILKGILWLK